MLKSTHEELVESYERLICSLGYKYTQFKRIHKNVKLAQTRCNVKIIKIPANTKYRQFYVHYNEQLLTCVILITPVNKIYIAYKNEYVVPTESNIIEIRSSSSVEQFIKNIKQKGTLS